MSSPTSFMKRLGQTLAEYAVTAPGVSYYTGSKEGFRRAVAHFANTGESFLASIFPLSPWAGPFRHYLLGPSRKHIADGLARTPLDVFEYTYKNMLTKPKNWKQHFLAWGINSPEFRVYEHSVLEGFRKLVAGSVHLTETVLPWLALNHQFAAPFNHNISNLMPAEFIAGIGSGASAQATKQALFERAGRQKLSTVINPL